MWLYHYADVAAGSVGWWIGSNPAGPRQFWGVESAGRVHIYAFNPSQAGFKSLSASFPSVFPRFARCWTVLGML